MSDPIIDMAGITNANIAHQDLQKSNEMQQNFLEWKERKPITILLLAAFLLNKIIFYYLFFIPSFLDMI